MSRKLLLFGNGLGRCLNLQKYDLAAALQSAWQDPQILNAHEKSLIQQCLPTDVIEPIGDQPPSSEDELDALQRVVMACDEILKYQRADGADWLTKHGLSFPAAIRRFIHGAACYFHEGSDILPKSFLDPLITHITNKKSHVATLNYDELLYRSFVGTDVFKGYSCLFDGFTHGTFSSNNLDRFSPLTQGYYLHLHGSPLYLTDPQGAVRKYAMGDIGLIKGTSSIHLVLAHINHKLNIIRSSEVLTEYWKRLEEAMLEVNEVTLVGYGGGDIHLNELVNKHFKGPTKQCLIVQYLHHDTPEHRKEKFSYWRSKLGRDVRFAVFFRSNILDFDQWDYVHTFTTP